MDNLLTTDQVARVVVIKRRLDSLNTPLMRELDSLERANRQHAEPFHAKGDLPDERNPAMDRTLDALHTNLRSAEGDATVRV